MLLVGLVCWGRVVSTLLDELLYSINAAYRSLEGSPLVCEVSRAARAESAVGEYDEAMKMLSYPESPALVSSLVAAAVTILGLGVGSAAVRWIPVCVGLADLLSSREMSSKVKTIGAVSTLVPASRPGLEVLESLRCVVALLVATMATLLLVDVLGTMLLLAGGELLTATTVIEVCWLDWTDEDLRKFHNI